MPLLFIFIGLDRQAFKLNLSFNTIISTFVFGHLIAIIQVGIIISF